MLSENAVVGILQACIAGAGLVLAIYSLILPVVRRLFQERSTMLRSRLDELKTRAGKLSAESPQDEFKQVADLGKDLEKARGFPKYLSVGMMISFVGYIFSALLSMFWLFDWYRVIADFLLPYFFWGTTVSFLIVGVISIRDAYSSLKKDLESQIATLELKKEEQS